MFLGTFLPAIFLLWLGGTMSMTSCPTSGLEEESSTRFLFTVVFFFFMDFFFLVDFLTGFTNTCLDLLEIRVEVDTFAVTETSILVDLFFFNFNLSATDSRTLLVIGS